MSDAITELRKLRNDAMNLLLGRGDQDRVDALFQARIAELEAQQAEPSDAEWWQRAKERMRREAPKEWADAMEQSFFEWMGRMHLAIAKFATAQVKGDGVKAASDAVDDVIDEAVALMRRGRGDKRLREAAKACLEQLEDLTSGGDHLLCVAALRAALESRQ